MKLPEGKGTRRRRCCAAIVAFVCLLPSGCATQGLSFIQDDRLEIHDPAENAVVSLPFTVRWTVENFDGSFVVFFDRSPMRPNRPLLSLVQRRDPCRSRPVCPDAQWLEDHNIYVTAEKRLSIELLPDLRDNAREKDRHELTIVLMDDAGRRVGESAFIREFIVERENL